MNILIAWINKMPIYTYRCEFCGYEVDEYRSIQTRDTAPTCDCRAWEPMKRVMVAPMVRGDYEGYDCPVTGKWIEGRKQHQENLKRHGCRVLEGGEKEYAAKIRRDSERGLEKKVEEVVERALDSLPPERLRVMQEGVGKVDIQAVRG